MQPRQNKLLRFPVDLVSEIDQVREALGGLPFSQAVFQLCKLGLANLRSQGDEFDQRNDFPAKDA